MPSACGLHCSLCNVIYGTRLEWLNHLLHPPHQTGTRVECGGWDLQVQECVLVVYASFPVATVTLLQFFSKKFKNTIVTDFVWSEKRPRVGILVFESRDKVNEILEEIGSRDVRVDSQLVRLKKGTDFIDLEWDEFIQDFQSTSSYSVELEPRETTPEERKKDSKTKKRRKQKKAEAGSESNTSKEENEENIQSAVNPGLSQFEDTSDLTEPMIKRREKKKKKLGNDDNTVKMEEIETEHQPQTEVMVEKGLSNSEGLEQFDSIRREIEIPDQDYEWALDMMEKLREIFSIHYPTCKVYMFRHWFLKLLSEGTNELLFYVDLDGVLDGHEAKEPPSALNVTVSNMRNLFTNPDVQCILPGIINLWGPEGAERHYERRSFRYKQLSTGRKFSVVNNPRYLAEVQTCRLAKYLLDFDPRAKAFLTMIFYWARKNDGRTSFKLYQYQHLSHAFAPEPSALIWMVILFLCQKKIVPTPREILQRPHQQLMYSVNNHSFDIGFSMDPKLAKKSFRAANSPAPHSNQFLIQLLKLAVEFFNLYGNLCSRWEKLFLNTLDAEILKKDDFLFKTPGVEFETKLTAQELARARSIAKSCEANPTRGATNLATAKMAILHPLIIDWRIMFYYRLFCTRTQYQMQTAAKEIREALQTVQTRGEEPQRWFDNGDFSFEKLLENKESSPSFLFPAERKPGTRREVKHRRE